MNSPSRTHPLPHAILACSFLLAGCTKALIYSEGTNISLATLKVNDNVAQPVSVSFGLERTIGTIAPPRTTGGEAVNMVSSFKLDYTNADNMFGTLNIRTQFASGRAGLALATDSPGAAARIMNISVVVPDSKQLRDRKRNAKDYVSSLNEKDDGIARVATRMKVKGNRPEDKRSITDAIEKADPSVFEAYANIIKEELGSPF